MQLDDLPLAATPGGADNMFFSDYGNWYAVQTTVGHEKKLISKVGILCKDRIKVFLPTREVFHTIKGVRYVRGLPLFPGYLFVYRDICEFIDILHKSNTGIAAKPVKANDRCLEVDRDEMKFLFDITGRDGVIRVSKGVVAENSEVRIVDGPLKNLKGRILYINKRKNKAKARIEMMNRLVEVSLGLEILSGSPSLHCP